ncbi:hypothetical protein CHUAL_005078 [Chamberlinius hualienensis]
MNYRVVVLLFVVAVGRAQPPLGQQRCDGLPKATFDIQSILKGNPWFVHYSINNDCSYALGVPPVAGSRGHDGTIHVVQQTSVISYDLTGGADNKSAVAVNCNSGERLTWNSLGSNTGSTGTWFCLYTCEPDGISLLDVLCAATDNALAKNESDALSAARGVQNFNAVKDARLSCNAPKFCSYAE